MNNPNSFDSELKDGQTNPDTELQGTEIKGTEIPEIDYKTKFSESAKEAQRLYTEKKALEQQLANQSQTKEFNNQTNDDFFPGFNELDDDARQNLLSFAESVKRKALEDVYKDPAIAYSRNTYNEKKWNVAFMEVSKDIPNLSSYADSFKTQYYKIGRAHV